MFSTSLQRLPSTLFQAFLFEVTQLNPPLHRRMIMLGILWHESGLTKAALQARVEAQLGSGCFGIQPTLAFARDIRFLRQVLQEAGYQLNYRRNRGNTGYQIAGRPELEPIFEKKLHATFAEVSPEQAAIFARLTPAERVWQGATLSDQLRAQAVRRLRQEQPELDEAEAHREVMRRMYQVEGSR